jgi:ribonucleotide monophosphatase NagD (HAD superfamily)
VIGSENIAKEFDAFGLNYFGIGPDEIGSNCETQVGQIREYMQQKYKLEENVGAVVVSLDAYFSLPKIVKAINYLKDPEVIFIATNMDDNIKYPEITFPDAGTFVNCIATGANRVPIVAGKSKILFDQLDLKVEKNRILMIGDRHELDVVFGRENGIKTLLVETGMSKLQDVQDAIARNDFKMVPDYIASSLGTIFETINK